MKVRPSDPLSMCVCIYLHVLRPHRVTFVSRPLFGDEGYQRGPKFGRVEIDHDPVQDDDLR